MSNSNNDLKAAFERVQASSNRLYERLNILKTQVVEAKAINERVRAMLERNATEATIH